MNVELNTGLMSEVNGWFQGKGVDTYTFGVFGDGLFFVGGGFIVTVSDGTGLQYYTQGELVGTAGGETTSTGGTER